MKVESIVQGLRPFAKTERHESQHSDTKLFGTDAVVFDENKQKEQKNGYQEFFEKKKRKVAPHTEDETVPIEAIIK